MSEEIKVNETRVQKYDQIIRIKKKRRKRDLDQVRRKVVDTRNKSRQRYSGGRKLYCNVEDSLRKTTNNVSRARQNNANQTEGSTRKDGDQIKQKTLCERLLPQPCIGIYRNGTSGKQMKKQNKMSFSENKNRQRLPGDVMKLLNAQGHSFKKTEDVRVFQENGLISSDIRPSIVPEADKNTKQPRVTMVEAEFEEKSIDDEVDQMDLINRMNTLGKECLKSSDAKCYNCQVLDSPSKDYNNLRSTPTGNNEIGSSGLKGLQPQQQQQHSPLHTNLETTANAEIQSVRRWRWSPITCFEEFCAKICIKHFVNCPNDGLPDPMERTKIILKDLYLEISHPDCDFHPLCKNSVNAVNNERSIFKCLPVSPAKMKQNDVNGRWNINCDMIPDWMTPLYKNESIARENSVIQEDAKTKINEIYKEKRRKLKLLMPSEAENSANFIEISKSLINNPSKMKDMNFRPNKANYSIKYDSNYKRLDDFSHTDDFSPVVDGFNNNNYYSNIPSITDPVMNKSCQQIQTPSVVFRMIRDNKSLNKRKLNHTKVTYKETKQHENKDKRKNVNCGKFEMTKGIFKNIPDEVSHEPKNRSFIYVERNKSNATKFYGDFSINQQCFAKNSSYGNNQCILQNKLNGRSEKSREISQLELLKWQNKPYNNNNNNNNNKHDYKVKDKVFPFHNDYVDQAIDERSEKEKLKHSRQRQQPTKYFAVENNNNSVDCPRRIAIYPHAEYPYNRDHFHCSAVRKPFYQSVDRRQVIIDPSLIAPPVVMFDSTKNLYHSKFHTVDAINNGGYIAQAAQHEPSEQSRGTLWINDQVESFPSPKSFDNHKSNRNHQSRIDHFNQINEKDSYYFH